MTRPLIGITSEMAAAGWDDRVREAVLLPANYAWALQRAGCVPVLLPPAPHGAATFAARLDGVLFSGGVGTGARRHGAPARDEAPEPDPAREAGELALMRAAIDTGLPVLAIGRGMHLLNAVRGGSVTEGGNGPAGHGSNGAVASPAAREVRISPDSRLGRLLGPSVKVPAEPEPAGRQPVLDRLGHGVAAVAWADDEAVAAIELAGYPFAIGLQWHPEDGDSNRLFEDFRDAASGRPAAT
jgi:gamma-glutamyl-gamma-aminobutyrate hydrolase PuuD